MPAAPEIANAPTEPQRVYVQSARRIRDLVALFRRLPVDERLSRAGVRELSRARMLPVGIAVLIDLIIVVALWGRSSIDQQTLRIFVATNLGTMGLDLAITYWMFRRGGSPRLIPLLVVLEIFACIAWLQMTGLTGSYFQMVPLLVMLLYRMAATYAAAITAMISGMALYAGAMALELTGQLPTASLFTDPSPSPGTAFQLVALSSLVSFYLAGFAAVSYGVLKLRERDAALQKARDNLRKAVEADRIGRLSGMRIGADYALMELLGRGGMGEVYRGLRHSDGTDVAIKVLHPYLAVRTTAVERFRREAEVCNQLAGAGVARVLDTGVTDDGDHFIVMEQLLGEDLAAFLRRHGTVEPAVVVTLVSHIATALDEAHRRGIIHRDLKPSNVFLCAGDDCEIRLLDFGVARLAEGSETLTETHAVIGSPGYWAPEQAMGRTDEVAASTDIFALGAIAYRLLVGTDAFPARQPSSAIYEVVNMHPSPPSSLDPRLSRDVDRVFALVLAKEPADRYATARDFADDLDAALANQLDDEARIRADAFLRARSAAEQDRTLTAER